MSIIYHNIFHAFSDSPYKQTDQY